MKWLFKLATISMLLLTTLHSYEEAYPQTITENISLQLQYSSVVLVSQHQSPSFTNSSLTYAAGAMSITSTGANWTQIPLGGVTNPGAYWFSCTSTNSADQVIFSASTNSGAALTECGPGQVAVGQLVSTSLFVQAATNTPPTAQWIILSK